MRMTEDEPTPIHFADNRDAEGRKLAVVYRCRVKWEELEVTSHDQVRYCHNCSQPVHQVQDWDGFAQAVAAGRCVLVKPEGRTEHYLGEGCARHHAMPHTLAWDD